MEAFTILEFCKTVLWMAENIIENAKISPLILGDGGYPFMKWLVTPYSLSPSPNLTVTEKKINKALFSAHVTSERNIKIFGILKY